MVEQLSRREKDKVKEINLLRTAKDGGMWESMITHALNGHGNERQRGREREREREI